MKNLHVHPLNITHCLRRDRLRTTGQDLLGLKGVISLGVSKLLKNQQRD